MASCASLAFFLILHSLLFAAWVSATRFVNIAANPAGSGIRYSRVPSHTIEKRKKILQESLKTPYPRNKTPFLPWGVNGQPGVAVGDFNGDGYDDIYVTNGPGAPNSLFINLYPKRKRVRFRNVAVWAGLDATDQDSTGVCYGDLNGDGHIDFVVLSEYNRNRIYLSNGRGRYRMIDWVSATGDKSMYPSTSCSIGDVNNDGKLDIFIANGVPKSSALACLAVPYDLSSPNQLFINTGARGVPVSFNDASMSSGINNYGGDIPAGKFTLSWTAAMVDINMDGNIDIVVADDQCGLPTLREDPVNGANRGSIRIQYGDGTGKFTTKPLSPANAAANNRLSGDGTWMGLAFGDFNCDGALDIFASNSGDYHNARYQRFMGGEPDGKVGRYSSRWWLGSSSGDDFVDASVAETGPTVFGWGNAAIDYDNDGDQDIVMLGSLQFIAFAGSDNPNIIYKNVGCGRKFRYDLKALEPTGSRRNYQGVAVGDFNLDGYPDIVSASGFVADSSKQYRLINHKSVLDKTAFFTETMNLVNNGTGWVWNGNTLENGDMMVQMNRQTDPSKCWVSIRPVGMQGVVSNGFVNRGALGATIIMRPKGRRAVMSPIIGGESFGSQHSSRRNFGLGRKCTGNVEILWPGGVRNRLYDVRHRETLILPEIPCDYMRNWETEPAYLSCVTHAVNKIVGKGYASVQFGVRLVSSATRARKEFVSQVRAGE